MRARSAAAAAGVAALSAALAILVSCPGPSAIPADAYLDSLEIATPSLAGLPDGSYRGAARVAVPQGAIAAYPYAEVRVDVAGGLMTGIDMIEPAALCGDSGMAALRRRIVAANSVDVDGVSGASFTSAALRLAVAKAVTR
jgi:uncharacterized protein with FMN-binding domain